MKNNILPLVEKTFSNINLIEIVKFLFTFQDLENVHRALGIIRKIQGQRGNNKPKHKKNYSSN